MKTYQKTFNKISDTIKKIFPFRNKKELLDFEQHVKKYGDGLKNICDDEAFFIHAKEFVAQMRISHGRLAGFWNKRYRPKNYQVALIENRFFLMQENKMIGEVLLIDDKEPKEVLKKKIKVVTGSTKQHLNLEVQYILRSPRDEPAHFLDLFTFMSPLWR